MDVEKNLKREIVRSVNAVKRKVKRLQDSTADNNYVLDTILKPITEPLNQIASERTAKCENSNAKIESNTENIPDKESSLIDDQEKNEDFHEHDKTFLDYLSDSEGVNSETDDSFKTLESNPSPSRDSMSWSLTSEFYQDVPYGVRLERGKHMMGSMRVAISDQSITVAGQKYLKTPGLRELLFKKSPNLNLITETDMENYKLLLQATNAHRRDFDPKKPIKSNKGGTYLKIIKPMFKNSKSYPSTSTESLNEGHGLPSLKVLKKDTDYVYWDDPNELVERLKLLVASREAGNTGLDGEILSILEELREHGVIN